MCRRALSNVLVPRIQAARNCALPGFDRRRWTGEQVQQQWMGAPERLDIDDRGAEKYPPEDPDEGCPGAWYRTPFIESVMRYVRRRDRNGNRIPSRLLDMCADELVIEAAQQLEAWEDHHRALDDSARIARLTKE